MEGKRSKPFFNRSGGEGGDSDKLKLAAAMAAADEDPELKSDAESSLPEEEEEEEGCIEELLSREGARRKLAILARLVGVETQDPLTVLTEVVRVLKDLDAKTRVNYFRIIDL